MRAIDLVRPGRYRRPFGFRRVVTHDFPLKATAVVIAILFWVAASQNAAPRMVTRAFDGRVPVERPDVPAGYVLRAQLGDVGVTLRGPEALVGRVALGDLRANVDMTAVDPARSEPQDAPVRLTVADPNIAVVEVSPPAVTLRFERIVSQSLTVQTKLANAPPQGSHAGDATVTPTQVRVTGPESAVAQIAAALATVRFGDASTDVTQTSPVVAVDKAGASIEGLTIDPSVVVVSVPVLPTATTRTVPIVYVLRGAVAPGYAVSSVSTDPPAVTMRGEPDLLTVIDRLETAPVDVTGLTASRSFRVALLLPQGVSLLRVNDAAITVNVAPISGTRVFQPGVQVLGLAQNLAADVDPAGVTVTLAGPLPALGAIGPEQVVAFVDGTGRGPGTYTFDVTVRAPSGATLQSVQPARVTVTVRSR